MMHTCNTCCAWLHKHGRSIGLFLLRVSIAIIMIYQGWGKLDGGMEGFTAMVGGLGFPAPALFAWIVALSEFVGGIAILLGVATRTFSALLAITMAVAIYAVAGRGFMMAMAPLSLLGSTLALFFTGPGRWSICRFWNYGCPTSMCGCCQQGCGTKDGGCPCAANGMEKDECCQDKKMKGKK